jgi:hypothetical protein
MQKTLLFASLLGALTLGLVPLSGCDGGTSGTAGSSGSGPTVEEACKDFAAAVCGQADRCSPVLLELAYGDQSTCEARLTPRCLAAPELDGSNVTADDIAACADAYEAQSCEEALAAAPSACRVAGQKADGETCAVATECKGNICDAAAEGECGKCKSPLAEGSACDAATDYCDVGFYCGSTNKCESFAKKGEACTDMKFCAGGLSCNAGKCGDLLPEGSDCSNGEICDGNTGVGCNPMSGKCIKVNIAKIGEACGFDLAAGSATYCEADATCNLAAMMTTGTCGALPKGGESCSVSSTTGNGNCISGYDCVNGKCTTDNATCN